MIPQEIKTSDKNEIQGSTELLKNVRGLFLQRGESLSSWCIANGIRLQNACAYLKGERNGEVAKQWRVRIVAAAKGLKV